MLMDRQIDRHIMPRQAHANLLPTSYKPNSPSYYTQSPTYSAYPGAPRSSGYPFDQMRDLPSPALSSPGPSPASSYGSFSFSHPSSATSVGSSLHDNMLSPYGPSTPMQLPPGPENDHMSFLNAHPEFNNNYAHSPTFPLPIQHRQQERSVSRASSHHTESVEEEVREKMPLPGEAGEALSRTVSKPQSVNGNSNSGSESRKGSTAPNSDYAPSPAAEDSGSAPPEARPPSIIGADEGLLLYDDNQTTPFISKLLHLLTHDR